MVERKKFKGEKGIYIGLGIMTLFDLSNVIYILFKGEENIRSIIEFLVTVTVFTFWTIQLRREDPNFLKRKR